MLRTTALEQQASCSHWLSRPQSLGDDASQFSWMLHKQKVCIIAEECLDEKPLVLCWTSVVGCLPSTCKALGSSSKPCKKQQNQTFYNGLQTNPPNFCSRTHCICLTLNSLNSHLFSFSLGGVKTVLTFADRKYLTVPGKRGGLSLSLGVHRFWLDAMPISKSYQRKWLYGDT